MKEKILERNRYKWLYIVACISIMLSDFGYFFKDECNISTILYFVLFVVGSLGYPLLAFGVVEIYYWVDKKYTYAICLLFIALISEIPFNIVCTHGNFEYNMQNMYWGLFLGYCMIVMMNLPLKKNMLQNDISSKIIAKIYPFICFGFLFFVSLLINAEYSYPGIIYIAMLNWAHNAKEIKKGKLELDQNAVKKLCYVLAVATYVSLMYNPIYLVCYIDLVLILLCVDNWKRKNTIVSKEILNEKKGRRLVHCLLQYFYPIHLVLMIVIRFLVSL